MEVGQRSRSIPEVIINPDQYRPYIGHILGNNYSWIVAVVTRVSEKSQTTADLIISQGHHPQKPPAFAALKGAGFRVQQKSVLPPHGVAVSSRIGPSIAAATLLVNVNGT